MRPRKRLALDELHDQPAGSCGEDLRDGHRCRPGEAQHRGLAFHLPGAWGRLGVAPQDERPAVELEGPSLAGGTAQQATEPGDAGTPEHRRKVGRVDVLVARTHPLCAPARFACARGQSPPSYLKETLTRAR